MPVTNNVSDRCETLNLRIKPAEGDLIDRAAKVRGDRVDNKCPSCEKRT